MGLNVLQDGALACASGGKAAQRHANRSALPVEGHRVEFQRKIPGRPTGTLERCGGKERCPIQGLRKAAHES
jgi:hypothetical protein